LQNSNKMENIKQPELKTHDASVLDLAFVMDCTGSMGQYIENARNSIRDIVDEIIRSEKSDVRLALVEYRDHPPQDETFVTRTHDFTASVEEMRQWLGNCEAMGGGDEPEAVADGLNDAAKLKWRINATKICVLISDAPPHGLGHNDSMPNGCPLGHDPLLISRKMAEYGITLYSVGCEPSITPYKDFFAAIAYTTGGQYVPLRNAKLLSKVIVGSAQEEISLEKLMEEVQEEVAQQVHAFGGVVDESRLTEQVQQRLASKGAVTKNLKLNDSNLERASERTVMYSKLTCMSDLRKEFKPEERPHDAYSGPRVMMMTRADIDPPAFGFAAPLRPIAMPMEVRSAHEGEATREVAEERYNVESSTVSYAQSERMVQKALNRMNLKK